MGLNVGRAWFHHQRAALGNALPQDDLVLKDRAIAKISIEMIVAAPGG